MSDPSVDPAPDVPVSPAPVSPGEATSEAPAVADVQVPPAATAATPPASATGATPVARKTAGPIRRGAPPPNPKSLAMRRRILIGIAVTCFILISLIAIRLYFKLTALPKGFEINVPAEMQLHIDRAKVAQQEIFNIEQKVWKDKAALTPEDLKAIQERRKALEEAHKGLDDLQRLVCEKVDNGRASSDVREMGLKLLSIKLWILDADDVVEKPAPPEGPSGFFIPLHTTIDAWRSAQREVQNISKTRGEILQRNDAEEKKKARATLQDSFGVLTKAAQAFSDLDDYVRKGLAREDLTSDLLPDLGTIQDEAALVGQTIRMARDLKAEFPE
jgi:hypothetical protein